MQYISNHKIDFAVERNENRFDVYNGKSEVPQRNGNLANSLFINGLVVENTEAKDKVSAVGGQFIEYNYVFSTLSENLKKEVEGK